MMTMPSQKLAVCGMLIAVLSGCKPSGPPPDIIEGQRKVYNDSKALEGKMQQQAEDRMKSADGESKN